MTGPAGRDAPMERDRRRRRVAMAIGTVGAMFGWSSPVLAHIDPEPEAASAGSDLVVGFTVEHGCDGSPTVQLDMRLPVGVTTPVPEALDGWSSSVDGDVVTFAGGPLPDNTPQTFQIRMTLPNTPGATLYFPFVQRCEVGEIRWIDVPTDGSGTDLDEPAPAMTLTEPLVSQSTIAQDVPSPVAPTSTASTEDADSTAIVTTSPASASPATTAAAASAPNPSPIPAGTADVTAIVVSSGEDGEASGGGTGGVWILLGSIAGVAVIGGLALRQSLRARGQGGR